MDPDFNVLDTRRVEMLAGLVEIILVMGRKISAVENANAARGETEGGVLVAPESDEEVGLWKDEVKRLDSCYRCRIRG